jgi:hypothetical protein
MFRKKEHRWESTSTGTGTQQSTADCLCIQQYCHNISIRKVGKSGQGVKLKTQKSCVTPLSTYLPSYLPTYLPIYLSCSYMFSWSDSGIRSPISLLWQKK